MALANIEMYVPKCYKDIYDRHRRGGNLKKELPDIEIEAGAGNLG